jgi:3-hydroxy-9,10-secoandrosta-1,3,5(10)-triene-9,17-dione monooxygenase
MKRDEYLDRVRSLIPAVRERAPRTESLRRVCEETGRELVDAGLFRGLQPARWGGAELDPQTFYEGVVTLAGACASTAWVLGVVGIHAWQLALFPEQAQRDVWDGNPDALASSSYAPTGSVERVPGGHRVRGRWSFSSGCDLCEWVILGGLTTNEDGSPDLRSFLLPRADYRIDDNWHVAGLCGTGSKDIVVEGAFVPEHRTHRFLDAYRLANPGQATNRGPLYRLPFASVFAWVLAAPAIGAAQGALELYAAQSRKRFAAYDGAKVAEDPFQQTRLADAAAAIEAARARLFATFDEMMPAARDGREIPIARRARARWDAAQAVSACVAAGDRLFEASGGRAIFLDNPIQRVFRDLHAMRAHALNSPEKSARLYARCELGLDGQPGSPTDLFV